MWQKFNSNLGNEVAENWRKKNCSNWFVPMLLPKWKEKNCSNWFVGKKILWQWSYWKLEERERERENCPDKKKSQSPHLLLLILFSMYFGIYSLVISYKPYKTYSTNMNLCDGFFFVFSFLSSLKKGRHHH